MLKNYLKIAWRNLWKNQTFSLINIMGSCGQHVCRFADDLLYFRLALIR